MTPATRSVAFLTWTQGFATAATVMATYHGSIRWWEAVIAQVLLGGMTVHTFLPDRRGLLRCVHCNRPIRTGNIISRTTVYPTPTGGTQTTTRSWHRDKPACEKASRDDEETAEATP